MRLRIYLFFVLLLELLPGTFVLCWQLRPALLQLCLLDLHRSQLVRHRPIFAARNALCRLC